MVEEILKDYSAAYPFNFMSLRYFNAAGADPEGETGEKHNPETHLIPLVLDAAAGRSKSIKVFGTDYDTEDGSCVRDYIHVTDLAAAHVLALEKLLAGHKSDFINLGTGQGYSVLQVIDTASRITGREIPYEATARRPGDPAVLIASNEKADKGSGLAAAISRIGRHYLLGLEMAPKIMADFIKLNPSAISVPRAQRAVN